MISPFVLPKIGSAARRYFLTGERFGADVASRIGLVHEVAEDTDETVSGLVDALLSGGPEAVRAAKRLVRERPEGIEAAHIAAERRTSDEGQAGCARSWKSGRRPGATSSGLALPGEDDGRGRSLGRAVVHRLHVRPVRVEDVRAVVSRMVGPFTGWPVVPPTCRNRGP